MSVEPTEDLDEVIEPPSSEPDVPIGPLLAHMTKKKDIPPGDIQGVLSQAMATAPKTINVNGVT